MPEFPQSILEFQRQFPDEAACVAWLAAARWPEGFRCPVCGNDHAWELDTKAWTWECGECHKQTSVTAGTVMHGSKLPLTVWFWASYLMATHSNGISARQMGRQLGLGSYKSAWLLCAKLRRAMVNPARALLSGLVEVDETQISCRTKDDTVAGGQGRDPDGKMQVIAAVEVVGNAPGRLRLGVIEDASSASLHPFIQANVAAGSTLKTDGWSAYPGVPSARTIARMMTIGRDRLSKAETVTVAAIESGVELLVEAREIVADFQAMIRKKTLAELDPWIERAKASLVAGFANGVTKDKAAVSAAISSGWSNGQAEGQICKLKLVKRQMYGRGKLDLLQARVIGAT